MAGKSAVISVLITGAADGVKKASTEAQGALSGIGKAAGIVGGVVGAGLAGAGVALFKIGSDFDEMSDKIRIGTGATGDVLKGLDDAAKNVLKSVPTNMADAGSAITDVSKRLDLVGKPLEDRSKQFLELSRITGTDLATNIDTGSKALTNFGVTGDKQGGALDELFRISQKTGVSFDSLSTDLAANGVVLRQAGLGFDESAALLGTLSKAGLAAGDVMPGLSKALAVAAKDGKPANEVLSATFAAIRNAPDDTAAAGAAMEVFGAKGGPTLAAAIREGKLSYDDLLKSVQTGGDTIMGAGQDTQDWGEKLTLLKNQALVKLEPVATRVFNAIGSGVQAASPYLSQFGDWLGVKIPAAVEILRPKAEALGRIVRDDVAPALMKVGGFIRDDVLPGLVSIGEWIANNQPVLIGVGVAVGVILVGAFTAWAVSAGAAALATVAAAAPVIALGVGIAALVAGLVWAYQNCDIFRAAVDGVASGVGWLWDHALKPFASWLSDDFTGKLEIVGRVILATLTGGLSEAAIAVHNHWDDIVDFVTGLPAKISSAATGMWDGIKDALKTTINAVISMWNKLGDATEYTTPTVHIPWPVDKDVGGWTTPKLLPHLTPLAAGGIALARSGGVPALIGEGGRDEAVVPLPRGWRNGGGIGTTVNNTVHASVRNDDDLRKLEEMLARLQRQGSKLVPA